MNNSIIPFYKQMDKLIVKAKDCFMFDSDNKRYLDFESGDWATNLGHSNDRINQIIKSQIELLIHDGLRFRNKQSEDLSSILLKLLSFEDGKSVFLNSGSEAVNLAITIAKNLTRRNYILKMDCSYLSAYGHGQISESNNKLINISIDNLDAISKINFEDIAAFVFEPGNSGGLVKIPGNNFIKELSSKVKENGGLLIANEVTTGFGRTGKWFGYQHYDFQVDIVSMGKALGNGYPISCVSVSKDIANLFSKNPFRYAQSHQNDPLGCAVGLEVINVIEKNSLLKESSNKGKYFINKLDCLQKRHIDKISDFRGRGLMLALEFYENIDHLKIYHQLLNEGILVGYREKVLRFMPPLIIEENLIDKLINTIDGILSETQS